ncbi:cytochrome P450 [Colletotrichum lupini]|uniref:Cytochrome P450 n=1 Tax=Colletotrichum lupini TaxID=145971 RepID=A0A9Q8SHF9_9PEZI|nr:cytochrome P450 [Colletotrichum lupini]UQC77446.1 cytochrome P450 [Colletotrichum lupini]
MDILKTNPVYLGGALVCIALAAYVYAGLTNPLSNIPGPWYTRFTTLPSTFKVITAHHPDWIHDLHAKYGPVVRYSPHEVDISDPPTCQRIHSVKTGFFKSPFYSLLITDSSSVFNEIRPEIHRKYKRLLSNPMSETGLKTFLPRIDSKVRLAIERIRDENKVRGAADIAKWFMFLSFDVIGDLAFGESFGNLESGKKNRSVNDFVSLGFVGGLRSMFPTIAQISLYLPIPVFKEATAVQYRTFDYAQGALDRHAKRVEETGSDPHPTVFSKLYNAGEEETWNPIEIRDNAQVFIVGGSDTTANSMIYLVWAVCKIPEIKAKLMKELDALPDNYTYDQLKELTFYPERWENTTQEMKDCTMPFGGGARMFFSEAKAFSPAGNSDAGVNFPMSCRVVELGRYGAGLKGAVPRHRLQGPHYPAAAPLRRNGSTAPYDFMLSRPWFRLPISFHLIDTPYTEAMAETPSAKRQKSSKDVSYELIYWPGLPGRGEHVRLLLEEAGAEYTDTAQIEDGVKSVLAQIDDKNLGDEHNPPPLAPPILKHGDLLISQTPNILLYLGPRLGLAPKISEGDDGIYIVNGLALTALDGLSNEAHDTHHPIATGLYYEDQKEESKLKAKDYIANRLPKFLGYFERVLKSKASGEGPWLYGGSLTYADLVLFQCIDGLKFAFPNALKRIEATGDYKGLFALYEAVKERPKIKEYLASDRRQNYSQGIYRHYPELDEEYSETGVI